MPTGSSAMIVGVFLLAGWVKGVVGMGLPTVAMGALGLAMPPVQAAAILVVPSLVTNVWQFVAGPSTCRIVRRLASMLIFVCAGTAFGIRLRTADSSRLPSIALGAVLAIYGLLGLFLPRLSGPRSLVNEFVGRSEKPVPFVLASQHTDFDEFLAPLAECSRGRGLANWLCTSFNILADPRQSPSLGSQTTRFANRAPR